MIFDFFKTKKQPKVTKDPLVESSLHDESTFYYHFIRDLEKAETEVIIESPYISASRMKKLSSVFVKLINKGVNVYVMTRDPKEHVEEYEVQSEAEIKKFERLGVQVLLCVGNHHRKLAIIDRKILWEGSLNILSQTHSREVMRRIDDEKLTLQMFNFLKLDKFL